MINRATIQGYLGGDPQLKKTPNGADVLTFRIANVRPDKEKTTDWISCIAWNTAAQTIAQYFHKGDEIIVEGRLQTRDWTDKNGNTHKEVEVITERFHFTKGKKHEETVAVDDTGELPF